MEVWNAILKEIHNLFFIILFVIFIVNPLMNYFIIGFDDSDSKNKKERSSFKVYTDFKTGRQYLVTKEGSIIPRLDLDGKQFIIKD